MKLSRQFPVNALRVFEAAARLGSFSKAAEELGMTQTAVSYQIKLLETYVGQSLFIRQPRQTVLTETGRQMLPRITEGFASLSEALQIARKTAGETLQVNAIPTIASRWLAQHLGSFRKAHTDLSVRLNRIAGVTDFNTSGADVSLEWIIGERQGLSYVELTPPLFSPLVSPRLAERVGGLNEPADLTKLSLIGSRHVMWQTWFAAAGVDDPEIRHESDDDYESQDLEVSAAVAERGVVLVAPFFFQDELSSGRLIRPFPTAITAPYTLALVSPQARRNAPKVKIFRKWIMETLNLEMQEFERRPTG